MGQVRSNLLLHAKGWPTAQDLDAAFFTGQPGYGMAAIGADKTSEGAEAIVRAVERDDPRPLWICVWGGANTLAQALLDVRATRPAGEVERFVGKLRVYSITDQDDAGPWIRREFPDLFYIVQPSTQTGGEYYYATWTGISGDVYYRNGEGADSTIVTNEWLDANIRSKGPLGKMYPQVHVHHGRGYAVVSGADRQRAERVSPAGLGRVGQAAISIGNPTARRMPSGRRAATRFRGLRRRTR